MMQSQELGTERDQNLEPREETNQTSGTQTVSTDNEEATTEEGDLQDEDSNLDQDAE